MREPIVDRAYARTLLPARREDGHKGDFGKLLVLGGSVGYTGAPYLTAGAAVRRREHPKFLVKLTHLCMVWLQKVDEIAPLCTDFSLLSVHKGGVFTIFSKRLSKMQTQGRETRAAGARPEGL